MLSTDLGEIFRIHFGPIYSFSAIPSQWKSTSGKKFLPCICCSQCVTENYQTRHGKTSRGRSVLVAKWLQYLLGQWWDRDSNPGQGHLTKVGSSGMVVTIVQFCVYMIYLCIKLEEWHYFCNFISCVSSVLCASMLYVLLSINQSIYLHQTTWIHITIKENIRKW